MLQHSDSDPSISLSEDHSRLICAGGWTLANNTLLNNQFSQLVLSFDGPVTVDGGQIEALDTAGALLLHKIIYALQTDDIEVKVDGLNTEHQALLTLVQQRLVTVGELPTPERSPNWFYDVGRWSVDKVKQVDRYLSFVGATALAFLAVVGKPRQFPRASVFQVLESVGCQSLGIVALMVFLIGMVLAYQLGVELQAYGADIYVVDASGVAILREFAPLITAIILAGRTSTSFAALIGTMKINEELDALETMGVSPIQRLVLPRILALLIAIPLLTVWASVFGILGSMMMSWVMMDINFTVFAERFTDMVGLKQYVLGMIKTPVFALIITMVGCFQGFQVGTSADSVGKKTTKAAVQSIFLIIIADALFSIIYSWKGL